MRRMAAILSAAAVAAMVVGLAAQNTKFNGKWALDQDKTTAANPAAAAGGGGGGGGRGGGRAGGGGGGRGGFGGPFTLAVDANTLTRTPDAGANGAAPTPTVYKLDGSEQTVPMGRGGDAKVKAKWDDSKMKIVIDQTQDGQNGPTTTHIEYSMDGDWLVIATTRPGRDGGAGTPTKQYYKKAS